MFEIYHEKERYIEWNACVDDWWCDVGWNEML